MDNTRTLKRLLYPLAALGLVATSALAAIALDYTTPSAESLQVRAAPVVWAAGPDSVDSAFVEDFALSANATYYTLTLKPVPEATVTFGNLTTLRNQDSAAFDVTVSADSVAASPKVLQYHLQFHRYGTDELVGTLNLTDDAPSVDLGTLAAGARLYVKTTVQLDGGITAGSVPSQVQVRLAIAS